MKLMSLDLSTKGCAIAVLDSDVSKSDGSLRDQFKLNTSFMKPSFKTTPQEIGQLLNEIQEFVETNMEFYQPDAFIIEEIFANNNNLDAVKPLIKIQAVVEQTISRYKLKRQSSPLVEYKCASSIRAKFGFNIDRILSESQFEKKQIEISKKPVKIKKDGTPAKRHPLEGMTYQQYVSDPGNYRNKYPEIDFTKYRTIKPSITEYDFAKKILVINFVNKTFGFDFTYHDNDKADAVLNVYYLYLILKEDNPELF